jgi:hypothetical protein
MMTSEPVGDAARSVGRVPRGVEKEPFWRGQIEGQAASGLSARQWCRREQLSEPSFYAWRRKLAQRDRERSAPDSPAAGSGFLPIRLSALAASHVELQFSSGLVIRVPAHEAAVLRMILEFVERRPC